ncbi:extensin [Streptomyces sp. K1PN6]|uniref:Extensin n=1 Tax=Streptomyces acidicola TaxID=2596892 RepID=A0A5N8WXW9_9ACTN|nr:extensin [Streptomyces acidicola]
MAPTRALTPAPTPTAPPAVQRRATPAAVPLRRPAPAGERPSSPGARQAVQRAVTPPPPAGRAVPLLSAAGSGPGTTPPTGAPKAVPPTTLRPSALPTPAVVQRHAAAGPRAPKAPGTANTNAVVTPASPAPAPAPVQARAPIPVQRNPGGRPQPTPATTTRAVSAVSAHGTSSRDSSGSGSDSEPPPADHPDKPPPGYSAVAEGQLDPRSLTEFQLDELTHKLVGRITRLIRTELRLDRERIGKLRDPRR